MRRGLKPRIPLVEGVRYSKYGEFFDERQLLTLTTVADLPTELDRRRQLIDGAKRGDVSCVEELRRRYRCTVIQ
jgi:adenine-specific DNA methylase